jgi:nucleoside-diphosphate-sugar epimerase
MKVLFVGGTGIISTACVDLAVRRGMDVYIFNRGQTPAKLPPGVKCIKADIQQEAQAAAALAGMNFDVVAAFFTYTATDVERDIRLFAGKTSQFIFISSASAYQKPPTHYLITESSPLHNPFNEYSRNKIACEERLTAEYRRNGFPMVIVRPSWTYGDTSIPLTISSLQHPWSVVDRMLKGKPIIIHGDGTNLWTCTHTTDFAKAFVPLMGDVRALGHAIHITSDEVLTWNQHYQIVADAVGVKPKFVHISSDLLAAFDPRRAEFLHGDWANSAVFDNSKIKRFVPDYVATTTFKEGMARTIANFKATERLRTIDPAFDPWCDKVIAAVQGIQPRG